MNENGRITGEDDGVAIETDVCCGDDNLSDVSVNGNDEITGEDDDGIDIDSLAGSGFPPLIGLPPGAAGFPEDRDADDNVCNITIDGNNEIDGVEGDGIEARCFCWHHWQYVPLHPVRGRGSGRSVAGGLAPLSSGDGNTSSIIVTNNSDIDGHNEGVDLDSGAGSIDGEADDNLAIGIVSFNGEVTSDTSEGIEIDIGAGSEVDEGDDNRTEATIEGNQEIGGNDDEGVEVDSFAGGPTPGSERNSTEVTIVQNGDIEGSESDEGIDLDSSVCCDPENVNTITISNNKGEITGHDDDGIEIDTCCSVNYITITDNEGNIRGGDYNGLRIVACEAGFNGIPAPFGFPIEAPVTRDECLKHDVTDLQVHNNSFSDSEQDGIRIEGGTYEDEELGIKSVISNNVVEGNGNDGIDIDSANGLNIGPANEIYENGTDEGGRRYRDRLVGWCLRLDER